MQWSSVENPQWWVIKLDGLKWACNHILVKDNKLVQKNKTKDKAFLDFQGQQTVGSQTH